jgi:hypothetical protein
VGIEATSAQFVAHDRVLYFLRDDSFGGLFEYDLVLDAEQRPLHKQYLSLEDLASYYFGFGPTAVIETPFASMHG